MPQSTACPVCTGANIADFWPTVWTTPDMEVKACNDCEALFLYPPMNEEQTAEFYQSYETHIVQRGVSPEPEAPQDAFDRRKALLQYRINRLEQFIPSDVAILEVGAAYGNVIGHFAKQGLARRAVAVEACPERRAFCCDHLKLEGYSDLSELPPQEDFDFIFLFHLLEHIPEPRAFIDLCASHLAPGGTIVVEVPSASDALIALYDCAAYKNFCFQPMHPIIYSLSSLTRLFTDTGFVCCDILGEQRYGLANHLQWLSCGEPGLNHAYATVVDGACDESYRERLIQTGFADTLFGTFKKPGRSDAPHQKA